MAPWRRVFRGIRRWTSLQSLVKSLPLAQLAPLAAAIAALFAILGPMTDVLAGSRQPAAELLGNTVVSGFLSVGYAFGLMRRNKWLTAGAIVVQVTWIVSVDRLFGGLPAVPLDHVLARMRLDAVMTVGLVIVSYSCFLWFINGTAARFLKTQAEIALAREIHRSLVPALSRTIAGYQFSGFSIPSGDVGGDLVDVADRDDGWIGYVADVSGHGVASGVVMSMFKSALRMRLLAGGSLGALLRDLNAVLLPLLQSSTYVTLVCVRADREGSLELSVAGHLPILRLRAGSTTVEEVTISQIPIGMFEHYEFASTAFECAPGDLLVLLTDGLTEVFDGADREFGLEGVKRLLVSSANRPLEEIGRQLVVAAGAHGPQIDDQTVLLIRRLQNAG